jgi:hypothetical protein
MIFAARQIQEKYQEQHQDLLYAPYDFHRPHQSFSLSSLRGTLEDLEENWLSSEVHNHHSVLYDGMPGCVLDNGATLAPLTITNGT